MCNFLSSKSRRQIDKRVIDHFRAKNDSWHRLVRAKKQQSKSMAVSRQNGKSAAYVHPTYGSMGYRLFPPHPAPLRAPFTQQD